MRKVRVNKRILAANEEYACKNRDFFARHKIPCLNMISSPGSGKTTILAKTITRLKDRIRTGIIEGDIQTDIDAQRIAEAGATAIQINTNGACHLSAADIYDAVKELSIEELDLVIIENVGNLVCPSAFDLGETAKAAVLSVPEGDDKPAKYPALFSKAAAVLINKIDLLDKSSREDFDIDKAEADILKLNRNAKIIPVSAKTGEGMDDWYIWLEKLVAKIHR